MRGGGGLFAKLRCDHTLGRTHGWVSLRAVPSRTKRNNGGSSANRQLQERWSRQKAPNKGPRWDITLAFRPRAAMRCAGCYTACLRAGQPHQEVPEEEEGRRKRARKAPAWLAGEFATDAEALPSSLAAQLAEKAEEAAKLQPAKQTGGRGTRMVNWRLLDRKNMVVELEHSGRKWTGVLERVGVSPIAGVVLEVRNDALYAPLSSGARSARIPACHRGFGQHDAWHPAHEVFARSGACLLFCCSALPHSRLNPPMPSNRTPARCPVMPPLPLPLLHAHLAQRDD